jgi:hypothetical protein
MSNDPCHVQHEKLHSDFLALWRRALCQSSPGELNAQTMASWAQQRELAVLHVEERDVGLFRPIRAVALTVDGDISACFPIVSTTQDVIWKDNNEKAERDASLWEKMEWFSPLWVSINRINALLTDVATCSKERAIQLFEYHTSTIYTLSFQAVCIAQLIPRSRSLAEFAPIAREAYLAFYSGHRASSIAALIPVIEGALTRISADAADLRVPEKIDRIIDRACAVASRLHFNNMWVPREYRTTDYLFGQDERVFTFETFRRWLKRSFFRHTGDYDGITWLNRHVFAHGASAAWQQSANFSRLIVALATLAVIESWHDESNRVSLLLPEMNEDSRLLWQQAIIQGQAQVAIKRLEQENYHAHGRLVPDMPTDDGVMLRKAILAEDCIKDLVRPLRNAGWSIEVGEPDARALCIRVVASSGDARLNVALLYSCATDNKLYRELAETADAILYRGAPYHQNSFAYGIRVHVGPVTGWQPPLAPQRN